MRLSGSTRISNRHSLGLGDLGVALLDVHGGVLQVDEVEAALLGRLLAGHGRDLGRYIQVGRVPKTATKSTSLLQLRVHAPGSSSSRTS